VGWRTSGERLDGGGGGRGFRQGEGEREKLSVIMYRHRPFCFWSDRGNNIRCHIADKYEI
jgi:hypothetical protein